MRHVFLHGFVAELETLPEAIQKRFYKQLNFLLKDLRHPSLRAKKYNESEKIWQARVDAHFRFYFRIEGDTYILFNIKHHKD